MTTPLGTFTACRIQLSKTRLSTAQCIHRTFVQRTHLHLRRQSNPKWSWFKPPPPPRHGRRILYSATAGAALTPAALVAISYEGTSDGRTGEQHMLDASRAEIDAQLPDFLEGRRQTTVSIFYYFDTYIWEPICTGARFLHLVVLFAPVILTIPMIFVGKQIKDRDNERRGALWWYWFLTHEMKLAGAAFIKLGQWAASRTDIFPKEMCQVMGELHSDAPPHSLKATKKTIEHAFGGKKFDDIFEEFHETPLGVGAIAQVYKAKLKPNFRVGTDPDIERDPPTLVRRVSQTVDVLAKSTPERIPSTFVAIKVLHPTVERIVRRDLRIMGFVASLINAIPTMEWLSFPDEVEQFGEMMRLQLDLRIEAANLTKFRKKFQDRTTAWFPYPYSDYSTRQVLIEEFAQGIPLAAFLEDGGGVFQKDIADEGVDAFLHMVLIDNFIHADLHPGNIMVRFYRPKTIQAGMPTAMDLFPRTSDSLGSIVDDRKLVMTDARSVAEAEDVTEQVLSRLRPHRHKPKEWANELEKIDREGYRPQLIFIDTGLVTELNDTNRANFLDLFKAVAEFDGYKAGHLMVERCRQPDAVLDKEVFALRMQHLVLGVKSKTFSLGNIKIGDVLGEVLDMVRSHHVRLEGDFVNVVLSILLLEGIGRRLDPEMDIFAAALPILRQLGAQGGASMLKQGDLSMLKVWVGLEARRFLTFSAEEVERCVKSDLLSPNV